MRALPSLAFVFALIGASHAQALSYGVAALPNGSTALVAEGRIHRNEAARLLTSVQRAAAVSGSIPRTLVISSPGGELVGALALGEALRQLGVRTVVGSIASDGYGQATLSPGRCHSACVFVLMGGAARSVVPGSLVGVHSPQPVMARSPLCTASIVHPGQRTRPTSLSRSSNAARRQGLRGAAPPVGRRANLRLVTTSNLP